MTPRIVSSLPLILLLVADYGVISSAFAEDSAPVNSRADSSQALAQITKSYASQIRHRIRNNIVLPRSIQGNPEAWFEIEQLPSGEITSVKIQKPSGDKALDEAVARAINKSSPFPKPDQSNLFWPTILVKYKPFDE